jgi:hypothetical protein
MSLLVAVKSTQKDLEDGRHDVFRSFRNLWPMAQRTQTVLKFFIGMETDGLEGRVVVGSRKSYNFKSDEVCLDVPDDVNGSVFKVREMCGYMLGKNLNHILIVDINARVNPERLYKSGYDRADYTGYFSDKDVATRMILGKGNVPEVVDPCYPWADKNGGYILSREAAMEIADTFPKPSKFILGQYDDFWVGQVLGPLVARGTMFTEMLDEPICE